MGNICCQGRENIDANSTPKNSNNIPQNNNNYSIYDYRSPRNSTANDIMTNKYGCLRFTSPPIACKENNTERGTKIKDNSNGNSLKPPSYKKKYFSSFREESQIPPLEETDNIQESNGEKNFFFGRFNRKGKRSTNDENIRYQEELESGDDKKNIILYTRKNILSCSPEKQNNKRSSTILERVKLLESQLKQEKEIQSSELTKGNTIQRPLFIEKDYSQ